MPSPALKAQLANANGKPVTARPAQAFAIIESQLGAPMAQVFSSISERPIAAASLGQVYKAVLRDTGEEVAVKVQRPGVEPIIYRCGCLAPLVPACSVLCCGVHRRGERRVAVSWTAPN